MGKKKKGRTQIVEERNEYIRILWKRAKKEATYPTTFCQLTEMMASMPTDRYFISEEQAYWLVVGHKVKRMKNKYKDILFKSFLDLYNDLLLMDKYRNMSKYKVIAIALSHPAPCIGLYPVTIGRIVNKFSPQNQTTVTK